MITAKEASIFVATEKQKFLWGKGNNVMEENALMEEVKAAYGKMIEATGSAKEMAVALGISHHVLNNRLYEKKGQKMSVEFALKMQKYSGTTHFAEAVAKAAGGAFITLPKVAHPGDDALLNKFLQLSIRLGNFSQEYQKDIEDGKIDPKEWRQLNNMSNEVHQTLGELMALIKQARGDEK